MNKQPWNVMGSVLPCCVLSLAALYVPQAGAAARAALVEETAPSRPFNESANGSAAYVTIGPTGAGTLAVSAMTLTNLGSTTRSVFVFAPVLAGGAACGSTNVIGGSTPRFYVVVPAGQTVHLTYPTPLVYPGVSGLSCVAFGGAANVDITVNGFLY